MKLEFAEHCDACEVPPRGALLQWFARARRLAGRFPAVSHGLLSLTDQAVVSATSFATMVIIGRATSPDQLGLYYLVMSIVFITVGVHEQIVATPYMVYSKRYQGGELASYTGSVWFHHFVLTALGAALLLVVIAGLSLSGTFRIVPGLWALLGAGPFILLREWVRRFAFAKLKIVPAVLLDAVVAAAQLGGLLLLWRLQLLSIFSIFGVMGAACAIACLGWFLLDRPAARFEPSKYSPDWTQNWSFGRWALRSYAVGSTIPFVMPWILGLTVGMAAAGVLGACSTLVGITNVFLLGVGNVLTPHAAQAFATGGKLELRRVLLHTAAVLAIVISGFCLLVAATGDWLMVLVFGDHFHGTGAILLALAASALMNGLGLVAGNGLWAIDNPRGNFVADAACLTVTLAVTAIMILPCGVLGAALAVLAGASTAAILRAMILVRSLADCAVHTCVPANNALCTDRYYR